MGRFPNIAASKAKTGAAKGKLYSMYAKEIYDKAKKGGSTNPDANSSLKRIIEKAKKDQVPNDIIKRAIDKVNSGIDESYTETTYEMIGPSGATFIIQCLTDNLNRTVSDLRAVVNKCHIKMGSTGSVSYNYDHLCIVAFKGLDQEQTMDALIENDIDIEDIEQENDLIYIYGAPQDLNKIKESIIKKLPNTEFEIDEISYLPKEKIILSREDKDVFDKVLLMLDDVEDVNQIYHNVEI